MTVSVKAGDGGDGAISFLREKSRPRGGPDGGKGGKGGDVVFVADANVNTLHHLRHIAQFRAGAGGKGGRTKCSGKNGRDLVVNVPVGTLLYDVEKNVLLKDLNADAMRIVACRGGRGGRGNMSFATSRNHAPRKAEPGKPGEERRLRLDLKMIAQVGLVGLPNAGKSTLLARVSHAKPKVADYPFTTLTPVLGVVAIDEFTSFIMADLPGMIEGAHEGVGLGDQFLRHVERTRFIAHLIDVSPMALKPPDEAYRIIRAELAAYSPVLAAKPEIVIATKVDLPGAQIARLKKVVKGRIFEVSGATGQGLPELVGALAKRLQPEPVFKS